MNVYGTRRFVIGRASTAFQEAKSHSQIYIYASAGVIMRCRFDTNHPILCTYKRAVIRAVICVEYSARINNTPSEKLRTGGLVSILSWIFFKNKTAELVTHCPSRILSHAVAFQLTPVVGFSRTFVEIQLNFCKLCVGRGRRHTRPRRKRTCPRNFLFALCSVCPAICRFHYVLVIFNFVNYDENHSRKETPS